MMTTIMITINVTSTQVCLLSARKPTKQTLRNATQQEMNKVVLGNSSTRQTVEGSHNSL